MMFATRRKNGFCAKGTIPIRRKTKEDIIKGIPYGSLGYYPNQVETEEEFAGVTSTPQTIRRYNGVSSDVNVWDTPNVDFKEYSAAAIGMREGRRSWCRAGIMVNFALYGDNMPRLFTSWKNASNHGCFNELCEGFVQMDSDISPGDAIEESSVFKGRQSIIGIQIYRDNVQGNWMLRVMDELVGYWPKQLFGSRFRSNTVAEWTGIVLNTWEGGVHTSTEMGSGRLPYHEDPGASYTVAAYFGKMLVINSELAYRQPDPVSYRISHHLCYSAQIAPSDEDDEGGLRLYYGGPGGAGCNDLNARIRL